MGALRPLMLAGLVFSAGQAAGQTGTASGGPLTGPGAPAAVAPAAGSAAPATPAVPPAAVLTLDQEALYRESRWGRRAQADLEARSREMAAENDRIAAQLEAEDDALTALRASLPEAEFRRRADAFDARVQQVRQDRDQAGRDLLATADADRTTFLNAALPALTALMRERGAVALLDRRTVFLSIEQIDVTAAMIARVDAELGDGTGDDAANAGPTDDNPTDDNPANDNPAKAAGADAGDAGAAGAGATGSASGAVGTSVDAAGGSGATSGAAVGAGAANTPAGAGAATASPVAGPDDHAAATVGGQADSGLVGTSGAGAATLGAPALPAGTRSAPTPAGPAPAGAVPPPGPPSR